MTTAVGGWGCTTVDCTSDWLLAEVWNFTYWSLASHRSFHDTVTAMFIRCFVSACPRASGVVCFYPRAVGALSLASMAALSRPASAALFQSDEKKWAGVRDNPPSHGNENVLRRNFVVCSSTELRSIA